MKRIITAVFCLLFCLTWNTSISQVNVYTEYQLPSPTNLSPFFIGPLAESAIYYGDNAYANPNKPVIVFVHGFVDLNNLWFAPGNDMYMEFHKRGYRTAFTATTRGEGMWYNGEMLSYMLDDITTHYGVNDVVIIAHSNGGKAAEVAMFTEGKYNKVDRVISLGTPFRGTGLANLAELPGFNWLSDLIGLGGGTSTSTTYYMDGYARPLLDAHPDNQPNKFINYGAWGYKYGNSILQPAMYTGGTLLNTMGGGPFNGGNDGVTPYYSSSRAGGAQMWPGYCWGWWCNLESKTDHIDIAFDYRTFDYFSPWLSGTLPLRMANPEFVDEGKNENLEIVSNYEFINPTLGNENKFKISKGVERVALNVFYKNDEQSFSVLDANKNKIESNEMAKKTEGDFNLDFTYNLNQPIFGNYELVTESDDYVAVVSYENGPLLVYDNSKVGYDFNEDVILKAHLENTDETTLITGVITHKNDIKGNSIQGEIYEVEFEHLGNMKYKYHLPKGLKSGIYTVMITAESEKYRRSAVAGFVVREMEINTPDKNAELLISNFPNPINDFTIIRLEKEIEGEASLNLFDNLGRLIKSENISNLEIGKHEINWDMNSINSGTYFLEFQNGDKKTTRNLVVLKR